MFFLKWQIPESFKGKKMLLQFPGPAGRRKLNIPSFPEYHLWREGTCEEQQSLVSQVWSRCRIAGHCRAHPPFCSAHEHADRNISSASASQIPFLEGLEGIEKGRSVESLHVDCASVVILHCRAEIGNTNTVSHKPGEVLQGISCAYLLAGLQMQSCQAKWGQPCASETWVK